ncbi:DNA topoisomerase 3 [Porphyromonas macacae]|uniref:DNA topoisomerase n=1 Tax=Porphyromonas macacae TaxID=28115 RepID=A0A379DIY0_9PORP|nr:DNA topoisomerase 3 [Porphyromonas macacae]SUB77983.1 DNA topoisomerase 3 [Porphyromonas macacae]
MILCIAEKPSVARDIASILGANERHEGYMEGNGYFVSWTFGHLCTLKEPHDYDLYWKRWDLSTLPMIPARFGIKFIPQTSYEKQGKIIKDLISRSRMVINCGDAGQEGELIQRWVLQMCGNTLPVKRLWISSMTDQAIKEGFQNLREEHEFQSLYEAGMCRAIGDWLLGMNATRLYTLKYNNQQGQVLSIGRVQTPTLALIVQRQNEIDHFIPTTYWTLSTQYREVTFSAQKGKFDKQEEANESLSKIASEPFLIKDISQKKGKELPPKLFDLTSLQVSCNKKFNLSAEETLGIIQSLYEKKLTTYPRVDTTYLSDDIYPKIPDILRGLADYQEFTAPLLNGKPLKKSKKVFDNKKVTDHHAIIPTGQRPGNLTEKELIVFDLITRHFIASFYPDCEISTTTVLGESADIPFKATGKEILKPGWKAIFTNDQTEEEDEENKTNKEEEEPQNKVLPAFVSGESGPHKPEVKEKQTQPPKPYTEATLLRAMETAGKTVDDEELREAMKENGIGRPSTRANIIETLFKRGYIVKERKSLKPTTIGSGLMKTINYELLKSPELTGIWEYKLRQIERKELEAAQFISELKAQTTQLVNQVLSTPNRPGAASEAVSHSNTPPVCPKCGRGYIIRGNKAFGCSAYKEGCNFRLPYEEYSPQMSDEELLDTIRKISINKIQP